MKRYVVQAKPLLWDSDEAPRWITVGDEYVDRESAEEAFDKQDEMYGHDTYHRLVVIKTKVLKEY